MTSRSTLNFEVKGQGQKHDLTVFKAINSWLRATWVNVKGHWDQGQKSHRPRSAKCLWYWQMGSHQRQVASFQVAIRPKWLQAAFLSPPVPARWALMHHFLSGCLSLLQNSYWTKIHISVYIVTCQAQGGDSTRKQTGGPALEKNNYPYKIPVIGRKYWSSWQTLKNTGIWNITPYY